MHLVAEDTHFKHADTQRRGHRRDQHPEAGQQDRCNDSSHGHEVSRMRVRVKASIPMENPPAEPAKMGKLRQCGKRISGLRESDHVTCPGPGSAFQQTGSGKLQTRVDFNGETDIPCPPEKPQRFPAVTTQQEFSLRSVNRAWLAKSMKSAATLSQNTAAHSIPWLPANAHAWRARAARERWSARRFHPANREPTASAACRRQGPLASLILSPTADSRFITERAWRSVCFTCPLEDGRIPVIRIVQVCHLLCRLNARCLEIPAQPATSANTRISAKQFERPPFGCSDHGRACPALWQGWFISVTFGFFRKIQ